MDNSQSERITKISLTEDEAKLYDRQIRLWGIEAQQRIRSANVLIVGVNGLSAEISKNLVLAGIKSLTLCDNAKVSAADLDANFLLPEGSEGESKVFAIRERLEALNPLVTLELIETLPSDFSPFDVICTTIFDLDQLIYINESCRKLNIMFFIGCSWGSCGFMFEDLKEHHYMKAVKVITDSRAPRKTEENDSETRKYTRGQKSYVSLTDAFDYEWKSDKKSIKRIKNFHKTYFVLLVFIEFFKRHKRLPNDCDVDVLKEICATCLPSNADLPEEYLHSCYGEFSPVCAITGGIISQEITKVISGFEEPIDNFFFFDSITCTGIAEHVGTDI